MLQRHIVLAAAVALTGMAVTAYALERPQPYLAGAPAIDYAALIGPPPAPGSDEARAERAGYVAAAAGIGRAGWQAATSQVHPGSPEVFAQIGCAIGKTVSPGGTPATAHMLSRLADDLRGPVEAGKLRYKRNRPYVAQADSRTCDPRSLGSAGGGALSYSYPSGHATFGELWSLALADVAPSRAVEVRAWGRSMGDNRIACRVHWPSDVAAGRRLADMLYARIVRVPAFKADAAAVRAELAKAPPATRCPA